MPNFAKMRDQMENGSGFIAALDQSGGSTPKTLALYGVDASDFADAPAMFAQMQQMRARIMSAPDFSRTKIIGTILFEKTLQEEIDGQPVPTYLWERRGIVPFLKIDKGMQDEKDGVQILKPIPDLGATLAKAKAQGVFGTKERSVIHAANAQGIAMVVANQFEVACEVIGAGMVPILEPEIDIQSSTKAEAEEMLAAALMDQVQTLQDGQDIMVKVTLPEQPGIYDALADHPRVLRVVALSGGYSMTEASARLAQNTKIIASFSRALTQGLQRDMPDADFAKALGGNIDLIYRASVA